MENIYLPFRVEFFSDNNLLSITLIRLIDNRSIISSKNDDVGVWIGETRLLRIADITNAEFSLIKHRLIGIHFRIRGTFVEFSVVNNIEIVLDAQLELEDSSAWL